MTSREQAAQVLKDRRCRHVVYGYRAKGKNVTTGWESEMMKFYDDDSFAGCVDTLQATVDGLEMVLAVHA